MQSRYTRCGGSGLRGLSPEISLKLFPRRSSRRTKKEKTIFFHASAALDQDALDLSKNISLYKILRGFAYVKSFVPRLMKELDDFPRYVSVAELADSTTIILRQEQRKVNSEEIKTLERVPQVRKESKSMNVYRFLPNSVLCVGGRLAHANLPDESKYQRLIPQRSHLARLVKSNVHLPRLHGGTTRVVAHIHTRVCNPSCHAFNRKFLQNCVGCNRFNVKHQYLLMEDLPKERFDVPTIS